MQEAIAEAKKMPAYAGASILIDQVLDAALPELGIKVQRQNVKLQPTVAGVLKRMIASGKRMRALGASGPLVELADLELPPKLAKALADAEEDEEFGITRIKEMTDPYHTTTRKEFTDGSYQDAIITQGLEKRSGAFFKHGFKLVLKPKAAELAKLQEKQKEGQQGLKDAQHPAERAAEQPGEQASGKATPPKKIGAVAAAAPPALQDRNDTDVNKSPAHFDFDARTGEAPQGDAPQPVDGTNDPAAEIVAPYEAHISTLMAWAEEPTVKVLEKMRTADICSLVQGRCMTYFRPSLDKLPAGKLPTSLITINTEDLGNPVVDILTQQIVAVRLNNMGRRFVAVPTEFVYVVRKDWALRKESQFYGASLWEAILTISKVYRKLMNYDIAKAIIAGYLTKLIIYANVANLKEENRKTYLQKLANDLAKAGIDITAFEMGGVQVTPVEVKVATDVLKLSIDTLETALMSAAGTTKSQMGRTEGLTRDHATVQEIAFIEYVRIPDEQLIKTAFEEQLFTPLLAHLAGKTVEELPVKVEIVREEPQDQKKGTIFDSSQPAATPAQLQQQGPPMRPGPTSDNTAQDNRLDQKAEDVEDAGKGGDRASFTQRDAGQNTFGASGYPRDLAERAVAAQEEIARNTKKEPEKHVRT